MAASLRDLIARWRAFTKAADDKGTELGRGSYDICAIELEETLADADPAASLSTPSGQPFLKPGWLAEEIEAAKKEIATWPTWMQNKPADPAASSKEQQLRRAALDEAAVEALIKRWRSFSHGEAVFNPYNVCADELQQYLKDSSYDSSLAPYLKDGETVLECIQRNRADIDALMTLLANEKHLRAVDGRALDAAWQDIHDWMRFGRELRSKVENLNFSPLTPTEAGIEKSEAVLRQISEASKLAASSEGRATTKVGEQLGLSENILVVPPAPVDGAAERAK